ncbi:MAG: AraC family transcriptional regulator [Terrimicrobiaceae bacterium]
MSKKLGEEFVYLPEMRDAGVWGVAVGGAGHAAIAPGATYPTTDHPRGHFFDWTRGRVLDALQVVLISEGRGEFESRETGRLDVRAGMAIMIFPGVWHRYRPDVGTGWREDWVEFSGRIVHGLLESGIFSSRQPLHSGAVAYGLREAIEEVKAATRDQPWSVPRLASSAVKVLSILANLAKASQPAKPIHLAVQKAERHMAAHFSENLSMETLASRLGVSYPHFRRAFRRVTGISPWQYLMRIRLARARRLVASSHATLEEIADQVGFSSAFHLSRAFKARYGQPPSALRRATGRDRLSF